MAFPWKYYESDAAKLLGELMLEKPQIAEEKKKGTRALVGPET